MSVSSAEQQQRQRNNVNPKEKIKDHTGKLFNKYW
jgi:hypothetical protein